MKRPILTGFGTDSLKWNEAFTQEIVERIQAEVPKEYHAFAVSFLAFRLLHYAGSMRDAGWHVKAIAYEMGGLLEKLQTHMREIEVIMNAELKKAAKRRVSSTRTLRRT